MSVSILFMFVFIAFGVTLLLKPLAHKLLFPYAVIVTIIGFIGSEVIVRHGIDTGIRFHNYETINSNLFLPIILFYAAFNFHTKRLLHNSLAILFLGIPVFILTILIATICIYLGIGHKVGFPWIAALLTATILASTNPRAIINLLEYLHVPERIIMLLEGESIFSDTTTIVLFEFLLMIALPQASTTHHVLHWAGVLIWVIVGGGLVGLLIGGISLLLFKLNSDKSTQGFITILAAYSSFICAHSVLHVSGAIAIVTSAIISRIYFDKHPEPFLNKLWDYNVLIASAGIFLLLGAVITTEMFTARWLAMIIGIISMLIARSISIYTSLGLFSRMRAEKPLNFKEQTILNFGATRGAIAIALAFAIPESLSYWWTIQSIVFGVVLFTLFVQAPMTSLYIKRSKTTQSENA